MLANLFSYLFAGYVLAEVRLYKKLKTDLDGKLEHVMVTITTVVLYRADQHIAEWI